MKTTWSKAQEFARSKGFALTASKRKVGAERMADGYNVYVQRGSAGPVVVTLKADDLDDMADVVAAIGDLA